MKKLNYLHEQLIEEEINQKKPMQEDNIKRICLGLSCNIYCTDVFFAQRSDTLVYDEPLYAHYLKNSNAKKYHPGAKEIRVQWKQWNESH